MQLDIPRFSHTKSSQLPKSITAFQTPHPIVMIDDLVDNTRDQT